MDKTNELLMTTQAIPPSPPVRYEGSSDRFRTDLTAYVGAVQIGWIRGGCHWDIARGDYWTVEAEVDRRIKRITCPTSNEVIEAAKRYIETAWSLIWEDYFEQPPDKKEHDITDAETSD